MQFNVRAHIYPTIGILPTISINLFISNKCIPLRGHRETEEALNKGNFLTMFKFISKYAPEVQARLEQLPRNATMMSPEIQYRDTVRAGPISVCGILF